VDWVRHLDWGSPLAWLTIAIAAASLYVAVRARGLAKRSAMAAEMSSAAATKTSAIAELVEQRKRYGWAIELRDGREGLTLRNLGTLDAHDVSLVAGKSWIVIMQEGSRSMGTSIVRAGQGKAFTIASPWAEPTVE